MKNRQGKVVDKNRIQHFMEEAVALSVEGMRNNKGGPFGAVIVRGNEIVGRGYNQVTSSNDPTAHAEIIAIRDACKNTGTFQLTDCELYTSCEPCPMCLGAIYWARPKGVYYANTRKDAAEIGFDDQFIYDEVVLPLNKRRYPLTKVESASALKVFREWQKKVNKTRY